MESIGCIQARDSQGGCGSGLADRYSLGIGGGMRPGLKGGAIPGFEGGLACGAGRLRPEFRRVVQPESRQRHSARNFRCRPAGIVGWLQPWDRQVVAALGSPDGCSPGK